LISLGRFGWAPCRIVSYVQVINLTLYEYSHRRQSQTSSDSSTSSSRGVVARRPASSSSSDSSCTGASRRYGVVKERSNPVDASICASDHLSDHVTRRHVFTSVSYVIELRVIARKTRDTDLHTAFLIHYQGLILQLIIRLATLPHTININLTLKWKIRGDGTVGSTSASPNRRLWARPEHFVKFEVLERCKSIIGDAGTVFPCVHWHFNHREY